MSELCYLSHKIFSYPNNQSSNNKHSFLNESNFFNKFMTDYNSGVTEAIQGKIRHFTNIYIIEGKL